MLAAAFAPTDTIVIGLGVPIAWTRFDQRNLAHWNVVGLGDIELSVRWTAGSSVTSRISHRVEVTSSFALPTTTSHSDSDGNSVPVETLPGAGAAAGALSIAYLITAGRWSSRVGVRTQLSATGWTEVKPGDAFLLETGLTVRASDWLFVGAGIGMRLAAADQINGEPDDDSGGFAVAAIPTLGFRPTNSLQIQLGADIVLVNDLSGAQRSPFGVKCTVAQAF
jgi:hypothetical protein